MMKYKKILFVIMLFPFSLMAQIQSTDIGFYQPNSSPIGIYWKNPGYSKTSAAIRAIDFGSYARQGIGFYTGDFADRVTSALERMRITRTGNVGIGTVDPLANLHIESSGNAKLKLHTTASNKIAGIIFSGRRSTGLTSSHYVGTEGQSSYNFAISADENLFLKTNGTNQLIVSSTGKIGIGTNTPEYKLDVNGTIRATEIKVEAQTADFVFEEDYQLKPLAEVEAFIKTNKHLPEIPSAKQMEADGVNVAEMNKLLLQKVEELTLYMISMQKQQEVQLNKNAQLEKTVKRLVDKVIKLENDE